MKQLNLLRQIIKETISEMDINEMARPPKGISLVDDWKEKLADLKSAEMTSPEDAVLKSKIYGKKGELMKTVNDITTAMSEKDGSSKGMMTKQNVANLTSPKGVGDTAGLAQTFKALTKFGILEPSSGYVQADDETGDITGDYEFKAKPKSENPGAKGRPRVVDPGVKSIGEKIAAKFAKGITDFTDEEKAYIMNLSKMAKSKK
jgi:hypothetical protein